jgi:hypothetical protein
MQPYPLFLLLLIIIISAGTMTKDCLDVPEEEKVK